MARRPARFLSTAILPEHGRADALCELNVIEQLMNVAQSTVLQDAWARGQEVNLHGWVYGVHDGLLQDLHMDVLGNDNLEAFCTQAISGVRLADAAPVRGFRSIMAGSPFYTNYASS